MNNRFPGLERRKFLETGVLGSLLALVFPVLPIFACSRRSKEFSKRSTDQISEAAKKYGAEFGGRNVDLKSQSKCGGQNGRF